MSAEDVVMKTLPVQGQTNLIFKDLRKRITKGFVSLNNRDRSKDQVPPEGFNVPQFLENPLVKYNHEFWKDEHGNNVTVGKALVLYVAEVSNIANPKYWGIKNVETGDLTDTFPKAKALGVLPGDRGLWTRTKYTVPEIWDKVKNGELNAYSWQGRVNFAEFRLGNERRRALIDIDLIEYSPVSFPDNPKALFVLEKGIMSSATILVPVRFLFSKMKFQDENEVRAWLVNQDIDLEDVTITGLDDQWQAEIANAENGEKEYSIGYEEGVQAISVPLIEDKAKLEDLLSGEVVTLAGKADVAKKEPPEQDDWSRPDSEYEELDVSSEDGKCFEEETVMAEEKKVEEEVETTAEEGAENTEVEEATDVKETPKAEEAPQGDKIDSLSKTVTEGMDTLKAFAGELVPILKEMSGVLATLKAEKSEEAQPEAEEEEDTEAPEKETLEVEAESRDEEKGSDEAVLSELRGLRGAIEAGLAGVAKDVKEDLDEKIGALEARVKVVEKSTPPRDDHDSKPVKKSAEETEDERLERVFSGVIQHPGSW